MAVRDSADACTYTHSPREGVRVFVSVKSQAVMVSTNIYHSHPAYKAHFALIVVYYVRATITR